MKKIEVDSESCIGCGACVAMDPEHFEFNNDGYSTVKSNENINIETVQNIIESCPVGIISLKDDDSTEKEETAI